MILNRDGNSTTWFSWDSKTMKHFYPSKDYVVLGPTKWNLDHNLKHGTIIVAPDMLGGWNGED